MQMTVRNGAPAMVVRAERDQLAQARRLLDQARLECEVVCAPGDCEQSPLCRWLDPAQLNAPGQAHAALVDAIEVLERSRHAFKSRELGGLRRRLESVLRELSAPD